MDTSRVTPGINWRKAGLILLALFLFVLAIQLLKSGAGAIAPWVKTWAVHNPLNALGFGWLFAYVVMSGSPVAAAALFFFDAGAVNRMEAFMMITGSRLGASFIVLAIGFLYALRGHDEKTSLRMGLLALLTTFGVQLPALALGYGLLMWRALDDLPPATAFQAFSLIDAVYEPIVAVVNGLLPGALVFLLGFGVLWYSLNLFDNALPSFHLQESAEREHPHWTTHPLAAFGLGLAVTSVTMSVSVSLSILVPLAVRGYIRRGNVIPYIMGANITTFVDTLATALLLDNPPAFAVVLVQMVSVLLVSLAVLLLIYRPFENALLHIAEAIGARRRTLALFLLAIVGVPAALMLIR
jgi:Na+/phosphate symporter